MALVFYLFIQTQLLVQINGRRSIIVRMASLAGWTDGLWSSSKESRLIHSLSLSLYTIVSKYTFTTTLEARALVMRK